MFAVVACLLLGCVLVVSACMKLFDGPGARAALSSYGVHGEWPQRVTWIELIAVESALGVAIAAQAKLAMFMAAGLMALFAITQSVLLLRGGRGRPCACFGSRGSVGPKGLAATVLLGAAYVGLTFLHPRALSTDEWLALCLGAMFVLIVALVIGLLSVAREVGLLRRQVTPAAALDVPHEGPEIGARSQLLHSFGHVTPEQFALAVFTSDGCRVCRTLGPGIASLARHPLVVLREFDEVREAEAWELADAPGSPYAVCLDADGTVLAKGTFNTAAQLESVLAAAERRRRGLRV